MLPCRTHLLTGKCFMIPMPLPMLILISKCFIDWRENTIAWSFAKPPFCNLQPPNTNYQSLHFPQKPTAEALGGAAWRLLGPRVSGSRVTKHQKKAKAMSCQSMSQFQRRPRDEIELSQVCNERQGEESGGERCPRKAACSRSTSSKTSTHTHLYHY